MANKNNNNNNNNNDDSETIIEVNDIQIHDEQLKNDREWTMKSNESIAYQMINNNIKQNYIIESTLLAIRNDIELMHDDIQANIKQEKKALSQAGKQNDNA